jgi:hypothetical protein
MKERLKSKRLWAVVVAVAGMTLVAASALQAAPPNRAFSATIVPTTATIGDINKSFTITITNVGSGGGASANLGSAVIQVPTGFTGVVITNVTASVGGWSGEVVGTEIRLTADQGNDTFGRWDYVAVTFTTATVPAAEGDYEWTTTLRKNANWHGPTPALSGTQPVVTVGPPNHNGGESSVSGAKFYDTNTNGVWNDGEPGIEGWKVHLTGDADAYALTIGDGEFSFDVEPGSYLVSEVFPPLPANWVATTDTSFAADVDEGENFVGPDFGNVCLGCNGGGHTLGYWSNKNGQATLGQIPGALTALSALNLVDASGNPFDPGTYTPLRTWLLNATATNMAYMLSAQLAAMKLNVMADAAGLPGFVDGDALVYAPGVSEANAAGFISINDLITAANNSLGSDGYTPAGDAYRDVQETIKNALDDANNNKNFVCPGPCLPIVYP